jgi:hypothetical protein
MAPRPEGVSSFGYLSRAARALPAVEEGVHRGGPAFRVRVGTWSFVDLQQLDDEEVGALVREAWETVTPKSIVRRLSSSEAN